MPLPQGGGREAMLEVAKLFSAEGASRFANELLGEPAFAEVAAGWDVSLALVNTGEQENDAPQALLLQLAGGKLAALRAVGVEEAGSAEVVLEAPAGIWRGVLAGQLDPVATVFSGKLKVKKGNVMALASRVPALRKLLEVARQVGERLG
jgi:putative sterol carrier protein